MALRLETHGPSWPLRNPSSGSGWTFFRQWLLHPVGTAALSPSSRQLAALMVAQLPPTAQRVVELGGGTGVFTRALLDAGIAPNHLHVVELNATLHDVLARRFPGVDVIHGDAGALPALLAPRLPPNARIDAVVSGLGLLSMSRAMQRRILAGAFAGLARGGRFIQFTYAPGCPVSRSLIAELGLVARRGGIAWRNMPPATVHVIGREGEALPDRAAPITPPRGHRRRALARWRRP